MCHLPAATPWSCCCTEAARRDGSASSFSPQELNLPLIIGKSRHQISSRCPCRPSVGGMEMALIFACLGGVLCPKFSPLSFRAFQPGNSGTNFHLRAVCRENCLAKQNPNSSLILKYFLFFKGCCEISFPSKLY